MRPPPGPRPGVMARTARVLLLAAAVASALLLQASEAKMLLTSTAPLGFNTFDSYPGLNHSDTLALADMIAAQLTPHGYEYLVSTRPCAKW